ncbi:MAG: hypothetical protein JXA14_14575 [Anaerolineae bacterium]|nr:hypothetical protein [Anaerolineae bacterium]
MAKKIATTRLLTDQPIEWQDDPKRDGLGFNTYAEVLAGAAVGTPGPFTIGVFGEWGTGKTSLMCMIERELRKNSSVVSVWFNAWRYEQDEHPIVPLVATIIRGLDEHKTALETLGEKGKSLVTALRAVAYGFSGKAKIKVPGFSEVEAAFVAKDMIERVGKLRADPLLDRSLYYEAFDRLAEVDVGDEIKVVVLIDDLDRCFPDRAIALLESIKLVLSQPGFVFVLGVSRRVIEGYLRHRYAKEYGIEEFDGADYLDKIVQLPFYIPPHRGRMGSFSESLLGQLQPGDKKALAGVLPIVGVACGNNPRTTVRFVNNLLIDKAIHRTSLQKGEAGEDAEQVDIVFFAITRALQQRWPDLFRILERSPELCTTVAGWDREKLGEYAKSEDVMEARAAGWLAGDGDLQGLLFVHGKEWLEKEDVRRAVVQFLWEQRPETAGEPDDRNVALLYSEDDRAVIDELKEMLLRAAEQRGFELSLTPGEMSRWEDWPFFAHGRDVVWIIGSKWKQLEGRSLLDSADSVPARRLFFVLLPEARQCSLPDKVEHRLTIQLPDGAPQIEDLRPLIDALGRARFGVGIGRGETDRRSGGYRK